MQYDSPISSGSKVMIKVKDFEKKANLQGQGRMVKKN